MRNIALWATLAIVPLLQACSDTDSTTDINQAAGQAHTSGIAEGFWPPQPLDITDVEALPASALGGARLLVLDAARRSVLSNPSVLTRLGNNYQEFDGSLGDEKSDIVATFLFYNYDTDETLTVQMAADNSIVTDTQPASIYQPHEHPAEAASAIELASATLNSAGFPTAQLQGTALLAFPKAENITSPDAQFYPQRQLYVTFGPGNGAVPVYSALVNLSTSSVTNAGLVQ